MLQGSQCIQDICSSLPRSQAWTLLEHTVNGILDTEIPPDHQPGAKRGGTAIDASKAMKQRRKPDVVVPVVLRPHEASAKNMHRNLSRKLNIHRQTDDASPALYLGLWLWDPRWTTRLSKRRHMTFKIRWANLTARRAPGISFPHRVTTWEIFVVYSTSTASMYDSRFVHYRRIRLFHPLQGNAAGIQWPLAVISGKIRSHDSCVFAVQRLPLAGESMPFEFSVHMHLPSYRTLGIPRRRSVMTQSQGNGRSNNSSSKLRITCNHESNASLRWHSVCQWCWSC